MSNPNFVKLAESMGCKGLKVSSIDELESKMKEFLDTDGPVLLECIVCENEHVYPMVPAGKALHEMELGEVKIDESHVKFTNSYSAP
jgi:acetolactate synthase-1/2/3 large subunit